MVLVRKADSISNAPNDHWQDRCQMKSLKRNFIVQAAGVVSLEKARHSIQFYSKLEALENMKGLMDTLVPW